MYTSRGDDFRIRLQKSKYAAGMVLYEVMAKVTKESTPEKIGEVTLESKFFSNEYGNRVLFIQHNID